MSRAKVKLAYISNDTMRRATFKKRKRGLIKKLNELTTLCGVGACAIMYELKPNDSQPTDIWPSEMGDQRVFSRFNGLSKIDQTNKLLDQRSYLKERIKKAKEQLMKRRRMNRENKMTLRMNEYVQSRKLPDNLSLVDLNDLAYFAGQKTRKIEKRLKEIKRKNETEMMMIKGFGSSSSSSSSMPVLEEMKKFVLVEDCNDFKMIFDAI